MNEKTVMNLAGYIITYSPDNYEGCRFGYYWLPDRYTKFELGITELLNYLNKRRFTFDEAKVLCQLIRLYMVK